MTRFSRVLAALVLGFLVSLIAFSSPAHSYQSWGECYVLDPEPWKNCDPADYPDPPPEPDPGPDPVTPDPTYPSYPDWQENEIKPFLGQDSNWSPQPGTVIQGYGLRSLGIAVDLRFSCNAIADDQYDNQYRVRFFLNGYYHGEQNVDRVGSGCGSRLVASGSNSGKWGWQVFRGDHPTSHRTSFTIVTRPLKAFEYGVGPASALVNLLERKLNVRARASCLASETLFVSKCSAHWQTGGTRRSWVVFVRRSLEMTESGPYFSEDGSLSDSVWGMWFRHRPKGF